MKTSWKAYQVVEISENLVEKITVKNPKTSLKQGVSLRFFLKNCRHKFQKKALGKG